MDFDGGGAERFLKDGEGDVNHGAVDERHAGAEDARGEHPGFGRGLKLLRRATLAVGAWHPVPGYIGRGFVAIGEGGRLFSVDGPRKPWHYGMTPRGGPPLADPKKKTLEDAVMLRSGSVRPTLVHHLFTLTITSLFAVPIARPSEAAAQDAAAQTGTIGGKVVDGQGKPLPNAQVFVEGTSLATQSRNDGNYVLARVPTGAHTVHARLLGYKPEAASVTVQANTRVTQDFTLRRTRYSCRPWWSPVPRHPG